MRKLALVVLVISIATPAIAQLRTEVVVTGLTQPVAFVADPSFPGVHYIVQQNGLVRVLQNGVLQATPFLDLRGQVSTGGEQGLLGLAIPPATTASRRVFVNFTNTSGDTVVARFATTSGNPLVADPATRFDLRWNDGRAFIDQPEANHNGGHLAFGPDGYLYIGLGDGGGGNDQHGTSGNAQNPNTLLGKMLRIDVNVPDNDSKGYRVPADNPFVDGSPIAALGEIWDFGLRNPWRYSFDEPALGGSGALFIGDVGQSSWEEVDYEPAASGGRNYGWRLREGAHPTTNGGTAAFTPLTDPILDYPRTSTGGATVFGATVTGGFVYRGSALGSRYVGRYFFADYINGRVWSFAWTPNTSGTATVSDVVDHTAELGANGNISSFGIDLRGELYLVIYGGRILRIASNAPTPTTPSNLSAQVSGQTVTLTWTGLAGASQYRVEVGSSAGAADLTVFDTGSSQTTLTAPGVPDGRYFVRVRAFTPAGWSGASNEITVAVGCTGVPSPPTAFTYGISGRTVTLTWSPPPNLTAVLLEVGSNSGAANLAVFVLPATATTVSGTVNAGTYFARLRSVSRCGTSAASSELSITVP